MIHSHHEHVPEFGKDSTHPEDYHIQPGATLVVTGEQAYRHIYVDGTGAADAIIRLTAGCKLHVQTILLNGTRALLQSDEGIACEVIWRGLPLNTTDPNDYFDPQQFGCGLVNISGEVYLRGKNPRSAKARLANEIKAGENQLRLAETPTNWQVGDTLCLPDTRQPKEGSTLGAQTEFATIAAIAGNNVLTLASPVAYDHLGLHHLDGSVRELAEVGNCSQSIVFRSANPSGVRGHMIHMDHCLLDMQGYTLKDMGRTTIAPLHSTIWDAHIGPNSVTQIGTNQIGRYADHCHGMPGRENAGEWQAVRRNFAIVGSPKLGLVLHHSTHFGLCEDFAIVDCAGCDITHETPQVYGNVYRRGFLCGKTPGSGLRVTTRASRNTAGGDHWHSGVGLGLQSAMAEFHDVSVYSRKEGIALVGFGTTGLFQPTKRGVHTDKTDRVLIVREHTAEKESAYPFLPTSNVMLWGCWRGIETWTANCWVDSPRMFEGLKIIHTRNPTDLQDQRETYLSDWRILGDHSQTTPVTAGGTLNTYGIDFKDGYRFGINIVGGEISGHDASYNYVLDDDYTIFTGVHIDCPLVAYHPMGRYDKSQAPPHTKRTAWIECTWGQSVAKLMDGWFAKYDLKLWMQPARLDRKSLQPITYEVTPWKDGKQYRVFHYEQHPDFALAPIAPDQAYGDWPAGVNTHRQLIERGLAIFGEAIPDGAIQREDFGPFYALDVTPLPPPIPPLTIRQRVERIEVEVFGEVYPNPVTLEYEAMPLK